MVSGFRGGRGFWNSEKVAGCERVAGEEGGGVETAAAFGLELVDG